MFDDKIQELIISYKENSLIRSLEQDTAYINQFLNNLNDGIQYGRQYGKKIIPKNSKNLKILDIGCSHGAMTAGIASLNHVSSITGLEIEKEAVDLANGLKKYGYYTAAGKLSFIVGKSEELPFPDCTFDLIFCHTVIEHVNNVSQCIAEMNRCIKTTGKIFISAPNYLWFKEPHLKVPMLPGMNKKMVKFIAFCLHKDYKFVDTLQFVTPRKLERAFAANGLAYKNLSLQKYYKIIKNLDIQELSRKNTLWVLRIINRLNMTKPIISIMKRTGIYPSVSYKLYKRKNV